MAQAGDGRPGEVFEQWARVRLPTSAPEISEHAGNAVTMPGDELYELLRQACEHGYASGYADGDREAGAAAAEAFLGRQPASAR